ncbi:MAG TPA: ABC transporter permease [Chitinophagaceae bacterium]|nr:ABC transporter permease [Chitinophagaceae bacterium]
MNTYTLHITLYDLFFFGMIFVGLTFALLLAFVKTVNRSANRFLALALVTMVLWMVRVLAIDIMPGAYLPYRNRLPMQFLLALGPLMYFYVLKITRPKYRFRWKDLLHFSPLLLEQVMLPFQQFNPVLQLLVFISLITYLYRCNKLIERFYGRLPLVLMDRSRLEFRWLRRLLAFTALLWCLWMVCGVINYFVYGNRLGANVYYPFYIFFAIISIWTAAAAFLKPQAASIAQKVSLVKPPVPAELRAKGMLVKRAMAANLYYQDPELSLNSLAEKLGIHPHELSKVINTVFKKNFNDFVNEYRVTDIISKLQNPAYNNITLLGIAYEAGFNSKATFNRTFKQITGNSPAEFKSSRQNNVSTYHLRPLSYSAAVISNHQTTPKWDDVKLNRNFMISNYLKMAWRTISRNKVYTAINILGLSVGICACLVIYLVTSFELSFDTFHPDKERIYRIVSSSVDEQGEKSDRAFVISALPMTLRNEVSGFEDVTGFYNYFAKVTIPGANNTAKKFVAPKQGEETSPVIVAEPGYFKIFQYKWLQGDPSTALNEPFKVVLSREEVYKYFGTAPLQDVMGKQVIYNDSLRLTISGIVEDWNKHTDFAFKDFISFATVQYSFLQDDIDLHSWGMWDFNSQGYVKLAKGVTPAQVEKQFPQFIKAHIKTGGAKLHLLLQPLSDVHFNNRYEDAYSRQAHLPTLYGLVAIAVFILLVAAINFINLSTAQSLRRAKEVGVRKVLGSSKTNLTIQFLIETCIITTVAVIIAVAAVTPVMSIFQSVIPQGVALHVFSMPVLLFLGAALIITSLVAGFYPARVISSYQPALSLKGQGIAQLNHKSYLRKTLIVFQFTVSLVFIIGTLIVTRQNHFLLNKDMGFNKDAIVTVHTDRSNTIDQLNAFCDELRAIPNVQMVSRHQQTPAAQRHGGTIIDYKGAGGATVDASFDFCDNHYVPLFGLKIIAGRNLSPSDTLKEYLVNETCARALGFKTPGDAIGKMVEIGMPNSKRQIVGVVKDFNSKSLHEVITPFFMTSIKNNERAVSIKLATAQGIDNFKETIAQVERAWKKVYPNNKFEYAFFDQTIAKFYDKEQKTAQLMNTAMLIAIFISCMGLFGLAIFTAQQRVKEIGIRKVLGASTASIVSMLSRHFLILVIISLAIASPIAYYFMHGWLQGFAYRINISPWTFLLSGLAAILIAFVTISFHAIKAAVANPVKSLRSE